MVQINFVIMALATVWKYRKLKTIYKMVNIPRELPEEYARLLLTETTPE